jgi:hypothetical protein
MSKMAAKHKTKIQTPHGLRTCFEARTERDGRKPLVARFGEIPLHRQKTATVVDRQPIRVDYPHKELLTRLLADVCEICQQPGEVEVHHIRKLANLGQPGPHAGRRTPRCGRHSLSFPTCMGSPVGWLDDHWS